MPRELSLLVNSSRHTLFGMYPHLVDSGPTISRADIAKFERSHNLKIPKSYRDFLLKHNGGRPIPREFRVKPKRLAVVSKFFPLRMTGRETLSSMYRSFVKLRRVRAGFLPVAIDDGGNLLLLGVAAAFRDKVYWWELEPTHGRGHEEDTDAPNLHRTEIVADTFTKFINSFSELVVSRGKNIDASAALFQMQYDPAQFRNKKMLRQVLEQNADPDVHAKGVGFTALHQVAATGNVESVQILLRAGASINHRDARGRTPLHYAAMGGKKAMYQAMIRLGADPKIRDRLGQRAVDEFLSPALRNYARI